MVLLGNLKIVGSEKDLYQAYHTMVIIVRLSCVARMDINMRRKTGLIENYDPVFVAPKGHIVDSVYPFD